MIWVKAKFIISTRLALASIWLSFGWNVEAFPIDEFKDFITVKPTVESFDFKVVTKKFNISGLRENTYRVFNLVYQDDMTYRLIEDCGHHWITTAGKPERKSTYSQFVWSRYQNRFWNSFNPKDAVTTSIDDPGAPRPNYGPAKASASKLRVAQDALNLGLMDLGTNGVIWTGRMFTCPSNDLGYRIDGELLLRADGTPAGMNYEITARETRFPYFVRYEFATNVQLPRFFPSRIKIERSTQVLSDYEIVKLTLSGRKLAESDVAFPQLERAKAIYVYTNNQLYIVRTNSSGSNQLHRVPSAAEFARSSRPAKGRTWVVVTLGLMLSLPIFYLVKNNNKTKQ
jgi:hypothetical protein